jgi:hypothetical protein
MKESGSESEFLCTDCTALDSVRRFVDDYCLLISKMWRGSNAEYRRQVHCLA